jgi:hypothetical protein
MTMNIDESKGSTATSKTGYEAPRLSVVGDARTIVLGLAGGGWDYFSWSDPEFEFEPDADDGTAGR